MKNIIVEKVNLFKRLFYRYREGDARFYKSDLYFLFHIDGKNYHWVNTSISLNSEYMKQVCREIQNENI